MAQDRVREMSKLEFRDPAEVLREFRRVELEMARHSRAGTLDMRTSAQALRTNALKTHREMRTAALFCYGMSIASKKKILFSPVERDDYDFVASWLNEDTQHLAPVQLKELVPTHLNSEQTLEELLEKAKNKYPNSDDLTLAIHMNRVGHFDPSNIHFDRDIRLAGIWAFCAISS